VTCTLPDLLLCVQLHYLTLVTLLLLLPLQPTVGFSLLSDSLPFRPFPYIIFSILLFQSSVYLLQRPQYIFSLVFSDFLPIGFHSNTLLGGLFSSIRIT